MNAALEEKNRIIRETNKELSDLNRELKVQRDKIHHDLKISENFFSKLVEAASDGISFYDNDNRLMFSNDSFFSILGMTRDEYLAHEPNDLLHPDCRDYTKNKNEAIERQGFFETEIMLRHKDGNFVSLLAKTVSIKDDTGSVIGSLTISRDITALKKAHEELVRAKELAEAGNRVKASFLSNISHEIRTPLNSVVGFSNLLLMDDISRRQKEDFVEMINSSSNKLIQIIGDIIDLSRLECSEIELKSKEISVSYIVQEVVKEIKANIIRSGKPIILNVKNEMGKTDDIAFADEIWLKRVLRHLLDNAVKFTFEGEVELNYSCNGNELTFSIRDTGIGINEENIEKIFDDFNQENDGQQRPFEGLGLGLTLAKRVVNKMGGRINVTSEKGVGSVFSVIIPYYSSDIDKNKEYNCRKSLLKWNKLKCLLVDDNKDLLLYVTRVLLDAGIQAVAVRSGQEALECLKNDQRINLILLNMQMTSLNSFEFINEIRCIKNDIPVIAQTAFLPGNEKGKIEKAGFDACLIRPIRRENLISVISSFTLTT